MENVQITPFLTVKGITAASGIMYHHDALYIVSDSSTFLYQYDLITNQLSKIPLMENSGEGIPKKEKPDFEVITLFENTLYIYGSGSTQKREIRVKYDLETKALKSKDCSKTYRKLRKSAALKEDDLNIEGAVITESLIYFFQRGNDANSKNGVFSYHKETKEVKFTQVQLPKINEIHATFTDAVLVDGTLYFLAAVENTDSTYADGEILGSFLGSMALETLHVNSLIQISDKNKFEGITLFKKEANRLEFLLSEDNDTIDLVSVIYKVTLSL